MEILRGIEDRGYPTDYLLSRIKGRMAFLINDWRPFISDGSSLNSLLSARYGDVMGDDYPEGIWRHLLKEFGWVYSQMNSALLNILRPFFAHAEIRTIFICLRYAGAGEAGKIERLLHPSLLSERMKAILGSGGHLASIVAGIEDWLDLQHCRYGSLKKVFEETGLRGVEQSLSVYYLEFAAHSKPHPAVKDYFVSIIDSRNILAMYKYITLNAKNTPYFINGGRISEKMFMAIADRKDISGIVSLVRKFTGKGIERPGTTDVENALHGMVTRSLRRAAGEPLSVGIILYYLWRCYLESRNLSTLFYGREIDTEILAAELAQ